MLDLQGLASYGWVPNSQDVATLVIAALVLWWGVGVLKNWNKRYPPGPFQWPILGNLLQIRVLYRDIENFKSQYGPIFLLRLGSIPVVVISNFEYAREICKVHDQNFAHRPEDTVVGKHLLPDAMSFAPVGDHWRNIRKVLATEIFIPKRLRVFKDQRQNLIVGAVNEMIGETNQGNLVNLKAHMVSLMYNVVTQMVMGRVLHGTAAALSTDQNDFRSLVEEFLSLLGEFPIKDWFPWTRIFGDFQGLERRMQNASAGVDRFLQASLDGHRKASEERQLQYSLPLEGEKEDIVDTLLQMKKETGPPFTDRERKLILQPLLTAGTEAASTVILWAVSELCRHPNLMKRVQDEIESVVGKDRLVQEHDLSNLSFLTAVIKETFRRHPNASLLPRQGLKDCRVGIYDIPSNARVLVSLWSLSRDPTVWESPIEFNPDRFLGHEDLYDFKGSNHKFIPFGAGRRLCPGLNLGLLMVQLGLANLVHLCTLTLPEGMKPEDIDFTEKPGINLLPLNPLKVFVSPRLAPEVYRVPAGKARDG